VQTHLFLKIDANIQIKMHSKVHFLVYIDYNM